MNMFLNVCQELLIFSRSPAVEERIFSNKLNEGVTCNWEVEISGTKSYIWTEGKEDGLGKLETNFRNQNIRSTQLTRFITVLHFRVLKSFGIEVITIVRQNRSISTTNLIGEVYDNKICYMNLQTNHISNQADAGMWGM